MPNRRRSTAGRPKADVHTCGDVVDITDRLSHLWQRFFHLFIGRGQQLLKGSERPAKSKQHRGQGERNQEGGGAEGEPHELLQLVDTPLTRPANNPILSVPP
jgi:hypothetical protein